MLTMLPRKKTVRMSRFSQNFTPDIFKNIQPLPQKQSIENNSQNQTDSLVNTRKSIFIDEKGTSKNLKDFQDIMSQNNEDDLFSKENCGKRTKFYEPQEINKYRQSLLQLPDLLDKVKKVKLKHIDSQFIEFFFIFFNNYNVIHKLLSSCVPHQAIIDEFIKMLHGFHIKKYHSGRSIEISRDDDQFYIFVEGIMQKAAAKGQGRSSRIQRKSFCQRFSTFQRSKLKTKTIMTKGKIVCTDSKFPILINQNEMNLCCTMKTLCECTFILLDKSVWSKFLLELQKLEEKHLVTFVKQWTTIRLNICTVNELSKKDKICDRKTFLYDLKHHQTVQNESDSENGSQKAINEKKTTVHGNAIASTYKLFNLMKDQKMSVSNQDAYLIVKGSAYMETEFYSMIISEGSIINSSILLDLSLKNVKIKALTDCLIVRLILEEIYLRNEDETDFIDKIKEIEMFRNKINGVPDKKCEYQQNGSKSSQMWMSDDDQSSTLLQQRRNNAPQPKKQKFEPFQLTIKDLTFTKINQQSKAFLQKERIGHYHQTVKTEPEESDFTKKITVKFANNYCLFQKIVESQEKVLNTYKINQVNKLFPIKELLKNKQFMKALDTEASNSRKSTIKRSLCKKPDETQEKQNDHSSYVMKLVERFSSPLPCQFENIDGNNKAKIDLRSLRERRYKFQKSMMQRKKKQKQRVIDNLFQISLNDDKKMHKSQQNWSKRQRMSQDASMNQISLMIKHNQETKLNSHQSERDFIELKGRSQISSCSNRSRGKYERGYLVTQPNYSEMKNLQKVISGQNSLFRPQKTNRKSEATQLSWMSHLENQNYISGDFLKMKKTTTRRIKTTMLNGRIREAKMK